jgi:hypothetical protein
MRIEGSHNRSIGCIYPFCTIPTTMSTITALLFELSIVTKKGELLWNLKEQKGGKGGENECGNKFK